MAVVGTLAATAPQVSQWYLWNLAPTSDAYHVTFLYDLNGPLAVADLADALSAVIAGHPGLRATFRQEDDDLRQATNPACPPLRGVEQAAGSDLPSRQAAAMQQAKRAMREPFDLRTGPLYRARLWRYAAGRHLLLLAFHHIVIDQWSAWVIERDLSAWYASPQSIRDRSDAAIRPARAGPQRRDDAGTSLQYWTGRLTGLAPAAPPADRSSTGPARRPSAQHVVEIGEEAWRRVGQLARDAGATRCAVVLALAWLFMARQTGLTDIGLGMPATGRGPDDDGVVGMFLDTVVLRERVNPHDSFAALVARARDALVQAVVHRACSLDSVVQAVRNRSGRLFDVLFSYAEIGSPADGLKLPGVQVIPLATKNDEAQFDLTIAAVDRGARLGIRFEYNADRYLTETAAGWGRTWLHLVESVTGHPDDPVRGLLRASDAERSWLSARRAAGPGTPPPAWILDDDLEPVPVGVIGEIYVTAEGGREPQPTGRLGRIRSDGQLEDHGGKDEDSVPAGAAVIRLSRIEAALAAVTGVGQVAAIPVADLAGRPELDVYLVESDGARLSRAELGAALAGLFGPDMPVVRFRRLPRLPLTDDGKPDRRRLAGLSHITGR